MFGKTWTQEALEDGEAKGILLGQVRILQRTLEHKFQCQLTPTQREKLIALTSEQREQLGIDILTATSLGKLGLEERSC